MKKFTKILANLLAIPFGVLVALYFILKDGSEYILFEYRVLLPWFGLAMGGALIFSIIFGRIAKCRINIPLRIIPALILFLTAIPEVGIYFAFYGADVLVVLFILLAHNVENKTQTYKPVKIFGLIADSLLLVAEAMLTIIYIILEKDELSTVIMSIFILSGTLYALRGVFGIIGAVKGEAPVEKSPVAETPIAAPAKEAAPVEEKKVEEAPVEEAPVEEAPVEEAPVEEPEEKEEKEKPTFRNYHVSKRAEDGKWTVKFAGGEKVIKLFDTQKEALEYTKKMAENQGGSVLVHNSKGANKGKIKSK